MGSPFENATWNGVEGAYYMGAGTHWEWIWLAVSIALCVMALFIGGTHEAVAYGLSLIHI